MKCIHCNNDMAYDPHRSKVYSIRNKDNVVIGITCRFCGWDHYKKKKPITKGEEIDSEYT